AGDQQDLDSGPVRALQRVLDGRRKLELGVEERAINVDGQQTDAGIHCWNFIRRSAAVLRRRSRNLSAYAIDTRGPAGGHARAIVPANGAVLRIRHHSATAGADSLRAPPSRILLALDHLPGRRTRRARLPAD